MMGRKYWAADGFAAPWIDGGGVMQRMRNLAGIMVLLLAGLGAAPAAAREDAPARRALWYYDNGHGSQGPLAIWELRKKVGDGDVSLSARVWRHGLAGWQPVLSTPALADAVQRARSWPRPVEDRAVAWRVLAGGGFSFGFFSPAEVNKYLARQIGTLGVSDGSSSMSLFLNPRIALSVLPVEYVQFELVGEIGWSPKTFEEPVSGYRKTYDFTRYSVGATVSGHLPLAWRRAAIFIGAGALYHHLGIEGYGADAAGFRAVMGVRFFNLRPLIIDLVGTFDYALATDPDADPVDNALVQPSGPLELDYTGGTLGLNVHYELFSK